MRTVKITSLSFNNRPEDEIIELVENEAQKKCDIILLPETWTGNDYNEPADSGATARLRDTAKKHGVYILNSVFRKTADTPRFNSGILIGRDGEIAGIYDKVYPYWGEFDLSPPTSPGTDAPVFNTDFGKVGVAICFDANFPRLWERLAENGADIVFWASAYSAGSSLQAHAINHNYYIVTSTLCSDCAAIDITGREIYYQTSGGVNISQVELNMNRAIFHENFNMHKLERLLRENSEITVEMRLEREQWFVLRSSSPEVSVRELAARYDMEELGAYKRRSRHEIDEKRGKKLN